MIFLKNKKLGIILLSALLFVVFSIYGIAKIKNNITEQQKRISSLEEFQKMELEERKQREDEANQQNDEMNRLNKKQEVSFCQKKKEDCENKIYEIDNGELQIDRPGIWKGSRTEMIKKLQDLIDGWKKNKKETEDENQKKYFQEGINKTEKEITKIKGIMASETIEKSNLLDGECKDYQNPCE